MKTTTWIVALGVVLASGSARADWSDDDDDAAEPETGLSAVVEGGDVTVTVLLPDAPNELSAMWLRRDGQNLVSTSDWTAEDGVETPDGFAFEYVDHGLADGCYLYELVSGPATYGARQIEVGAAGSCPVPEVDDGTDATSDDGSGCSVSGGRGREAGLGAAMLGVGLAALAVGRRRRAR